MAAATAASPFPSPPRFFPAYAADSIDPSKLSPWKSGARLNAAGNGPLVQAFGLSMPVQVRLALMLEDGDVRDRAVAKLPAGAQWLWSMYHVLNMFETKGCTHFSFHHPKAEMMLAMVLEGAPLQAPEPDADVDPNTVEALTGSSKLPGNLGPKNAASWKVRTSVRTGGRMGATSAYQTPPIHAPMVGRPARCALRACGVRAGWVGLGWVLVRRSEMPQPRPL